MPYGPLNLSWEWKSHAIRCTPNRTQEINNADKPYTLGTSSRCPAPSRVSGYSPWAPSSTRLSTPFSGCATYFLRLGNYIEEEPVTSVSSVDWIRDEPVRLGCRCTLHIQSTRTTKCLRLSPPKKTTLAS
ncbi:hypothetical protein PAXRUDRAFT_710228 [Paxillus rubicundulus Ve08.2h10]|uniref:Uncharacterized protein n=1 Tax=Paxillus rubicundulus Ve08.2h10 TaxID=930991 RepID=A0A0D0DRX7_9AGAM|nr:hypothetical protein PAXRUDRAFT_710228 [Paxillus rubicundulus Ve08.2h10]